MKRVWGVSSFSLAVGLLATMQPSMASAQANAVPAPDAPGTASPVSAPAAKGLSDSGGDKEIVVTGYRSSLRLAEDYKRRAVGSEEDILAQDIASFPDLNLAESIQRVPGVTITRDSGEGRQITLRGLGPDFTRTELNGMEVLSNTASGMDNRGATSRTRAFDFSLFASELFNRVTVRKSYTAEEDEGGIGGSVALYSAKPFDYNGPKFVVSAKGQTNSNTHGVTPRLVALASKTWGDFGLLASAAYGQIKSNEYGYRNWGWGQVHYNAANVGPEIDAATAARLTANDASRLYAPQAQSPSSWYTDRRRLGLTTSMQYHPGDNFKLDVDVLYGRLWDYRNDWALAAAGNNPLTGNVTGTQVIHSATIQDGALIAGSYTGVDFRSEHHIVRNHTDFVQAVGNAEWKVSDRLTVSALTGYEESDFRQPEFDKVYMQSRNHSYTTDQRFSEPRNTYGFDLTDPNQWNLNRLDTQENSITSKYWNGKLEAAYQVAEGSTFKIGTSYKKFENSGYQWVNKVFYNTPTDRAISNDLKIVTNVNSLIPYIGGDVDRVYNAIGQIRDLNSSYLQAGTDFQLNEKTWNAYAQYDLDTEVGGMRLRANAGVHYFDTRLISNGNIVTGSGLAPVSIPNSVHGWLPAANVALNIADNVILRASANRNINRPALTDLAAAGSVSTSTTGGGIGVGNPFLKPYKATSVEGSAEYYFDRTGYMSLGFFYKKMDSFITSYSSVVPYNQTGFPLSLLLPGTAPDAPFTYTRPINGDGASIKGVEAALQKDFTFLPAPFDKLGAVVNGTYFDGHQKPVYAINGVTRTVSIPLFNLSKWAANATLYYEDTRWGVRVSDAYRSHYLIGPGYNGNIGEGIKSSHNIDAQAHLNITPKLRVVVEGINLTNQPIDQYTDQATERPITYTRSGRTFTLGVTAEF